MPDSSAADAPGLAVPGALPAGAARGRGGLHSLSQWETLNFLCTNRIPRVLASRLMGRLSRIQNPYWLRSCLAIWRQFAPDLDLSEAEGTEFRSLHEVFTRRLKAGARPVDPRPDVLTSPCDAIVGAMGRVQEGLVLQAKGMPYALLDLLGSEELVQRHEGGCYVTLRLTSSMYHRFHAPCDGSWSAVRYLAGDAFNVNPIALKRIPSLFCKNERAVLDFEAVPGGGAFTLVPVAAVLVASMRLHCLPQPLDLRYRGPQAIPAPWTFAKGAELGYFEHGSTLLVFATGPYRFAPQLEEGRRIRVGEPLLQVTTP
jgi:phosphatidylserine decarboxylase